MKSPQDIAAEVMDKVLDDEIEGSFVEAVRIAYAAAIQAERDAHRKTLKAVADLRDNLDGGDYPRICIALDDIMAAAK